MKKLDKKKVIIGALFILVLVFVYFIAYTIRCNQIDAEIDAITASQVEASSIEEDKVVKSLKVFIDNKSYTLPELKDANNIPTIVDVVLMYEDNSMEKKQAYVSYSDDASVIDIEYIDNDYGRLILPQSMKKPE